MNIKRILKHLSCGKWLVSRYFTAGTLSNIESAIQECEKKHSGELLFVIEHALDPAQLFEGVTARERAVKVFSDLRIWDTENNNGVLLYLLLADRDIEIVADRGINRIAGDAQWQRICGQMEQLFREGNFEAGVVQGIRQITEILASHFPPVEGDVNELSNKPVIL